jgi:hypothetical protein
VVERRRGGGGVEAEVQADAVQQQVRSLALHGCRRGGE